MLTTVGATIASVGALTWVAMWLWARASVDANIGAGAIAALAIGVVIVGIVILLIGIVLTLIKRARNTTSGR